MMEIWDGYLKDGTLADVDLVRGEPIPDGLYHLVCEILVRHDDGDYLVMQRDFNKPNFGGYFEATAGGSALKGEDKITCAKRELLEETGIIAGALEEIGTFLSHNTIYFQFLCRTGCDKASISLQKGETISYKWLTEKEFIAFVNSEEFIPVQKARYADYFKRLGYIRYPKGIYKVCFIHTLKECQSFAESFVGDPDFADPMLINEEQHANNLLKAINCPEDHRVFGIYRDETLVGIFSFLLLPEERYAEMLVGLSRDKVAYQELFAYLREHFPSYNIDFVLNPRNHLLRELLIVEGALFEAEQQKMVFSGPVPTIDTAGVELYSEAYAEQYFEIHNKDMYWTGEKVAATRDRFRTLLAICEQRVVGYLDVTYCFAENEPYDLFVLPAYRKQGFGRKLLAKALELNRPNSMMLLVDTDNEAAIKLYVSSGFKKADAPNSVTAHWTVR